MNMNEKDIDHLTRKLMRGTAEQPSASLNSRIMALIIQEKKRAPSLQPDIFILRCFAGVSLLSSTSYRVV